MMTNPLLSSAALPKFQEIKAEHVVPAIEHIISSNKEHLKALLQKGEGYTWDNLIQPIDEMEDALSRAWSPISHLNSVVNSPELRDAYNACLPLLTDYGTEISQNSQLCDAYKQIASSPEFMQLSAAQQKSITDAIRDFRLSGVDLSEDDKKRYKEISQKLSQLTSKFSENVLDATNAWEYHSPSADELAGMPDSALDLARQTAIEKGKEGYILTLQLPSYIAAMTYANSRDLREKLYKAYSTRASELGENPEFDNTTLIEEILALRHEQSRLLDFDSYADKSLARKMANDPLQVMTFLREMAAKSRPQALIELEEMKSFASKNLGLEDLKSWDFSYVAEKIRLEKYSISQEELKSYFTVENVTQGLFSLVDKLFSIKIKQNHVAETWHPDVRFYDVFDEQGELKAQFYLDLFARMHKQGGAWMDVCRSRMLINGELQTPVAYLTCNSAAPSGGKPALFTHDEVITLFHEFGHGLHHMLTEVDYPSVSGIAGVEWDAVELPSQFMENWCWKKDTLDMISSHYETGAPISDALFDKLIASKNFQSAMQILRQVEFSLFDIILHADFDPLQGGRVATILQQVRNEVAVVVPPDTNRFQNSFSHIFSGGYAAGYYSYKWAEVLSADAFARFEEEGLYNREVGESFRANVLAKGGSRTAMENFMAFRGREPSIDALLKHCGLVTQ